MHEVVADGDFGDLYTVVKNFVHPDNPKTSYLAALSVIGVIKKNE
jgi:aspartate dehydrogenase